MESPQCVISRSAVQFCPVAPSFKKFDMDKLEAVQRVLRFSESVRNWCEEDEKIFFDDFDNENIMNYDVGGYGELADTIIKKGIEEGFIDEDDLD